MERCVQVERYPAARTWSIVGRQRRGGRLGRTEVISQEPVVAWLAAVAGPAAPSPCFPDAWLAGRLLAHVISHRRARSGLPTIQARLFISETGPLVSCSPPQAAPRTDLHLCALRRLHLAGNQAAGETLPPLAPPTTQALSGVFSQQVTQLVHKSALLAKTVECTSNGQSRGVAPSTEGDRK